ncbi:MAG TPA: glycosyltransferase family 2 protein [Actinocatenispora sp.]
MVIPTHDRPELLRAAIASVLRQDHDGAIRVVVVYDRAEPDPSLAGDDVTVLVNSRTPGLAGARNTGILALSEEDSAVDLVAFCDDDDTWLPGKLTAQVAALAAHPGAEFATCAIEVDYDGVTTPRLAGTDVVVLDDLARSRMAMLHASTFLVRRAALGADRLGLVAEDAPGSQNEDYDLLLRAARRRPIAHVDRPLVRVRWGRGSFFAREYRTKIESLTWMLDRHPELSACRTGSARLYGQLACWHAAAGDRRIAVRWARRSLRRNPREPRAVIALAAAAHLVSVESVLGTLHRRGRGI